MRNILFLTNLATPYRVDFFNELGKISNLTVLFEARRTNDLTFNWNDDQINHFRAVFLTKGSLNEKKINFNVFKYIKRDRFDLIVFACYYTWTEIFALTLVKLLNIPYAFETDGGMIANGEGWISRRVKTFLIKGASQYFSPSTGSDNYLRHYGANATINRFPFTSLMKKDILSVPLTYSEKKILRHQLGIEGQKVIITVGQFIHRKGFDILLKSCENLGSDTSVHLIGGTPTIEYLQIIKELNLTNVHFHSFMSGEDVKTWLRAADLFVLPTREDIWGLVINEAMAAGLPVITTNKCVAGVELLPDRECLVEVDDVVATSNCIRAVLNSDEYAYSLATNNLKRIQESTLESMALAHLTI